MKQFVLLMSVFITIAGVWLLVMENILKHSGYAERSIVAAAIVVQGIATALCVVRGGNTLFRIMVSLGAVATGCLGVWAINRILGAQHFEGFVLVIGCALLIHSLSTLAAFSWRPGRNTA